MEHLMLTLVLSSIVVTIPHSGTKLDEKVLEEFQFPLLHHNSHLLLLEYTLYAKVDSQSSTY